MNKKGSAVIPLFVYAFFVFLFMIFFGIALLGFNEVNKVLDDDIDVGQVNLQDINDDTFGALVTAMLEQADMLALVMVLGMVVMMMLNAFFFGNSNKLWIPVDILILIFVFILAVYFSSTYDTLINADSTLLSIYADNLPRSSAFLLNLPSIIATIGAIMMIVTYTRVNRDQGGATNVLGYQ